MNEIIHEVLHKYWGYSQFRPMQEEIITSLLDGHDTLGLMPTGGGKSLTFQVPTLSREGICLVITPLVALMKDQVDNLRSRGIRAAYLHAGMTRREMIVTLDNCLYGRYKFLYIHRNVWIRNYSSLVLKDCRFPLSSWTKLTAFLNGDTISVRPI